MKTVVGLYDRLDDAQKAVREIRDAGFQKEEVMMMGRDASRENSRFFEEKPEGQEVSQGVATGGIVVISTLVDLGLSDEHAHYYAEGIRRGGTLVVTRMEDNLVDQTITLMNRHNAVDVFRRAEEVWRKDHWDGYEVKALPLTDKQMEYNRMWEKSNVPVTGADREVDGDMMDRQIPGSHVTGRELSDQDNGLKDSLDNEDLPPAGDDLR